MADSSLLVSLLDRAGKVFSLAGELGRAFHAEQQAQGGQIAPATWNGHAEAINQFFEAILGLREAMQNPPDGFWFAAEILIRAASIAKRMREAMLLWPDECAYEVKLKFVSELKSVCDDGQQEVAKATKDRKLDDPFAFVERPSRGICPLGWEGDLPIPGIVHVGDLRKYLGMRLAQIRGIGPPFTERYFIRGREALRNALRGFDHLNLQDRPKPWPADFPGITIHQVEENLSVLWGWLEYSDQPPDNSPNVPSKQATPPPTVNDSSSLPKESGLGTEESQLQTKFAAETNADAGNGKPAEPDGAVPESPTGFLGGTELADALGIHPLQRDAFFKTLERKRQQLSGCWIEPSNRRANGPQFLYRIDNSTILEIAARYQQPKSV